MKHLVVLAFFLAAVAVAAVVLRRRDDTVHYRGRDYIDPTGCTKPSARDLPLHPAGHGVFVPSGMPKGLDPVYVYVSRGGCLHAYDLSGGP